MRSSHLHADDPPGKRPLQGVERRLLDGFDPVELGALQLALEGGQIAALEHGEIGGHRCMLAENWISFVRSSVIGIPAMMAS